MAGDKWSEEELNILKENAGKVSIYRLMELLPLRTRYSIKQTTVKKLGLSTRFLQPNKTKIDYSFFNKMSPRLAHFIGFWYADGNISKNIKALSINIYSQDHNGYKRYNKLVLKNWLQALGKFQLAEKL